MVAGAIDFPLNINNGNMTTISQSIDPSAESYSPKLAALETRLDAFSEQLASLRPIKALIDYAATVDGETLPSDLEERHFLYALSQNIF